MRIHACIAAAEAMTLVCPVSETFNRQGCGFAGGMRWAGTRCRKARARGPELLGLEGGVWHVEEKGMCIHTRGPDLASGAPQLGALSASGMCGAAYEGRCGAVIGIQG